MSLSQGRVQIIVAIIGVVGTITVALITSWSSLFSTSSSVSDSMSSNVSDSTSSSVSDSTSSNVSDPNVMSESLYLHKKKIERFEILPGITGYKGTAGYIYKGTGVNLSAPDDNANNRRSKLILLEDGNALGPPHSGHADIQMHGGGRYSHWNDGNYSYLFFSTSDNSDPLENMRVYSVATRK